MRLLILAVSFLILISGAAYSTYWFYAAGRVGVEIGSWSRGEGPFGLTIATAMTPQIRGFPFSFSITLGQTTIQDPARWSDAKVTVPNLVSWCHPWSPHQWSFEAGDGASFDGQSETTDHLKIQSFKGEVQEFSSERGRMVAADVATTRLEGKINGAAAAAEQLSLHIAAPEEQPQLHTGEALTFAFTLEDMKLPDPIAPLGQTIGHISAVGAIDGTIPRETLPKALGAWRDAGGTVEVHHLTLQWGPLSLSGDGTMALDKALQPIGAFSTQIVNYSSVISALVSSGMIKEIDGAHINIGLALLAQKDEEGHSFLKAPLTLQNNNLFIGPAKLIRLPQITWH